MKTQIGKSQNEKKSKLHIPQATVGIVDIVSSTRIGNAVEVATDWDIKEQFLDCAAARAEQFGMLILNQTGDGFLFLVKEEGQNKQQRVLGFQKALSKDFSLILARYSFQLRNIESGIRTGIAQGELMIGWTGETAVTYQAAGSVVNKAARLASLAKVNQVVFCENCRIEMEQSNLEEGEILTSVALKGFEGIYSVSVVTCLPQQATSACLVSNAWLSSQIQEGFCFEKSANSHFSTGHLFKFFTGLADQLADQLTDQLADQLMSEGVR